MPATELLQSLPPRVAAGCRVLVLGSMPGAASLAQAQYYAHPRNRFWPLMSALCGFPAGLDYAQRLAALQQAGVGLWDVIGQCHRRGSLDADIVPGSEIANALPSLWRAHPDLRAIAFNGGKAAQAFARHFPQGLPDGVDALALPSTSPANASYSFERLRIAWEPLRAYLR
ncbi:DNA-deoxyinosine glycosylase [Pseudoxanthomonas helianthi]|uniref:DNA-deoxyinosine glycosylase n=1 Tax=Pseudoxanthomonas helianthi TaxID=1453541 RepID=A0A940X1Z7_9GAMM|nr:DNA-deoxyinosine glycosylase [Pseudoxanthomonas helianthi]MBP3983561.1 DNA-deoxyinosine glycosylase [Pseudoxanthomonas helianthi]